MEELQKKHRQEQKDLQARITQKKKSATKKTRKGVNDECATLERELKERQQADIHSLKGHPQANLEDDAQKDEELLDPLKNKGTDAVLTESMNELSISPSKPQIETSSKKPNRHKARLARRAAEQEAVVAQAEHKAASLPDLRQQEHKQMRQAFESRNLVEHEIRSDGHCLYAAVADQLIQLGEEWQASVSIKRNEGKSSPTSMTYQETREVAASYIEQHPDDFQPFLEEPLDSYVRTIRETGEWGGHLELLSLAKACQVSINVLQASGRTENITGAEEGAIPEIWLAYYHHSFGLGEHYNSLRRVKT